MVREELSKEEVNLVLTPKICGLTTHVYLYTSSCYYGVWNYDTHLEKQWVYSVVYNINYELNEKFYWIMSW